MATLVSNTHLCLAKYGAGTKLSVVISSSNSSSVTLKERFTGCDNPATANILPPILKQRSFPHLTSSVTAGRLLQNILMSSIFTLKGFNDSKLEITKVYGLSKSLLSRAYWRR